MDTFTQNGGIPLTKESVNSYFSLECQSSSATTQQIHASNAMHELVETSSSSSSAIDDGISADADISQFLSRKVQIATYTWAVGAHLAHNFRPWDLFLANPAVVKKIDNYFMIKGNLKVTFFVNGTPFHAGMMLASYSYMGVLNEVVTIGGDTQLVTRSQRPHLYLNASTNKGGCMCLPFFLPQNYLSLTDPILPATDIGTMNLDSFAPLAQINGGTDSVTITVFAEMTDVKLTVPTMVTQTVESSVDFSSFFEIEPQGDEYSDKGPISGPASTIATYAGMLSTAPVIGPFALATQIGAGAMANIAKLFGYSRPIMLSDIVHMRNFPVSSLALTEGSDSSQKLTVTGKQEITIDPLVVGLPSTDSLSIKNITQTETYLTSFDWEVTDTVNSGLFACRIDPMNERITASAFAGYQVIPTALSFATRPFQAWSGTLKYRFQIIASQYHRGRISIIYDPTGPLTGDPYNTTFNTIIDLADGRDFTVSFKWQRDMGYMEVSNSSTRVMYTTTAPDALTTNRNHDNGVFYVRVVNELVVPDGTSKVIVLVSVSAGDDYEIVNPTAEHIQTKPYVEAQSGQSAIDFTSFFHIEPQSAVEETPMQENAPEGEINELELTSKVMIHESQKPLIFYGEKIMSFRQLLKRYTRVRTLSCIGPFINRSFAIVMRAMPPQPGHDPAGPDATALANPYMYAEQTLIGYLKGAYAGWRGSIRWKVCPLTPVKNLSVSRHTGSDNNAAAADLRPIITAGLTMTGAPGSSITAYNGMVDRDRTFSGTAITQNRSQDALEFEIPMANNLRFCRTSNQYYPINTNTLANSYPGGDSFVLAIDSGDLATVAVDTYCAAGEDFSFYGWVGAPVHYTYGTPVA